jgi:phage baseplate assembly protein W
MTLKRRFRAWRFLHPDFDRAQGMPGLRPGPTGRIDMVEGDASVRQAVLLLLTTRPGERVMLPTYGCDLQRLLFAPNDHTTAGLAIHYVRRALTRWEPRIDILDLDAVRSPEDPSRLDIHLDFRVRPTLNEERLTLSLNLTGPER